MSSALETAPPPGAPSGPAPTRAAVGAPAAALRRLPAVLARSFDRGVAFVRWLVAAIVEVARRTFARVGMTLLGGVVLLVVLVALALTFRTMKPRG